MRKITNGLLAASLLWAGASTAMAAGPLPGQWYLSPLATFIDGSVDRLVDDRFGGGQLGLGYALNSRWLIEGVLQYHDFKGFQPAEQWGLSVDVINRWNPDAGLSPYALVGLGYLTSDGVAPRSGAQASVGLGVLAGLTQNIALRGDYRVRFDLDSPTLTDQLLSAGLTFAFGTPTAAPVAPPPVLPPPPVAEPTPPPARPCPTPAPGQPADAQGCALEISLPGVNFAFDSAQLLTESQWLLNQTAAQLRQYPHLRLEVAGHTDSTGDADYNQGLSERRAQAVRDYLVRQGVPAANLTVRGYGESQPIASNDTVEGRAQNRRVALRFLAD